MPLLDLDPPPIKSGTTRRTVLWQRRDVTGLERCDTHWDGTTLLAATGVALVALEDGKPASAAYELRLDLVAWTQWIRLQVAIGNVERRLFIASTGDDRWTRHYEQAGMATMSTDGPIPGARDIDLGFSPLTNTLAIHRLGLEIGESEQIGAAWLRFPELDVRLLPQRYTRLSETTYRYESESGFSADLEVDDPASSSATATSGSGSRSATARRYPLWLKGDSVDVRVGADPCVRPVADRQRTRADTLVRGRTRWSAPTNCGSGTIREANDGHRPGAGP
jgi:hypothetical protein